MFNALWAGSRGIGARGVGAISRGYSSGVGSFQARPKIAVVGAAGNVGAATCYSLVHQSAGADILVVDANEKLSVGQALDLSDGAWHSNNTVRKASIQEAGQAEMIIITAGAAQRPGEPRSELLGRNNGIIKSIVQGMQPIRKDAKIMLVANPVDVLTAIAHKHSGLPHNQVFGSGTLLDSARLRNHLSTELNVAPKVIDINVLGEHGDAQFVGWESGNVNGVNINTFDAIKSLDKKEIETTVMRKAYTIIENKGSTYFGIGTCASMIANDVINSTRMVRPVTCYNEKYGTYLSMPAVIHRGGIERILDIPLSEAEREKLQVCIDRIKEQSGPFI